MLTIQGVKTIINTKYDEAKHYSTIERKEFLSHLVSIIHMLILSIIIINMNYSTTTH